MDYDRWMRPSKRVRLFLEILRNVNAARRRWPYGPPPFQQPRGRLAEEFEALARISRDKFARFAVRRNPVGGRRKVAHLGSWIKLIRDEENWVRRNALFVAYFTNKLEKAGLEPPIVTGGVAAMIYAPAWVTTEDIDLIVKDREKAARILKRLGFEREQRIWYSKRLGLAVEMPSNTLTGSTKKVRRFEIEGLEFFLIGVEDLIVQRLVIGKRWRNASGLETAVALLTIHGKAIDMPYLKDQAKKQNVEDALENVMRAIKRKRSIDAAEVPRHVNRPCHNTLFEDMAPLRVAVRGGHGGV